MRVRIWFDPFIIIVHNQLEAEKSASGTTQSINPSLFPKIHTRTQTHFNFHDSLFPIGVLQYLYYLIPTKLCFLLLLNSNLAKSFPHRVRTILSQSCSAIYILWRALRKSQTKPRCELCTSSRQEKPLSLPSGFISNAVAAFLRYRNSLLGLKLGRGKYDSLKGDEEQSNFIAQNTIYQLESRFAAREFSAPTAREKR